MKINKFIKIAFAICIVAVVTLLAVSCDLFTSVPEESSDQNESSSATCDEHQAGDWIIDTEATCSAKGSKHNQCINCGETLATEVIEMLAHTEEIVEGRAATCSEEGLTQGKKCSVCDATLLAQTPISKIPHTEEIVDALAATCTENGLTQGKKCSVCNETITKQDTISPLGHTESDWIIDKPASVGVDGEKHKECTRCQVTIETASIPAMEEGHVHSGSSWEITKPATCAEAGSKSLVCECGETIETQLIPKTGEHTRQTLLGKAATCKEQGLTDGVVCSVCQKILVSQTATATLPHTPETVLGKNSTCTVSGSTNGKKCSVCDTITVTQLPIYPEGHKFVGGACAICGIKETYSVWITDGLGKPMTDIVVKVMKGGEVVKMAPYNGKYTTLDLEDGNYTVELDLSLLGENYVYDTSSCKLSASQKTLSIKLYRTTGGTESIYVSDPIDADYNAQYITEGSYSVSLTRNGYSFFIFTPEVAAIYTITYECDSNLTISYHGSTFFVQGNDISQNNSEFSAYGNGFSFSIYPSNIGASYVFAIKSKNATKCVLNIKNVGDPGTRLVEEPWTPYQEDPDKVEEMKNYPQEGTYTTIDLGDTSISAVLNPDDGYYHLNSVDGPVLFLDFTTDSKYIASIYTICANQRMGAYIYDADGNVVEKRSYNELFFQCGMPDPTEVETRPDPGIRVPLTEKLAEAIQSFGNNQGWWSDGDTNIFTRVLLGAPYNKEFAWLLYCGYYE